ncbi:MAG: four helix bundle protein [Chloroflexi bacterium]|nr:four helix bundle protein [Chloroflexota bacterium]
MKEGEMEKLDERTYKFALRIIKLVSALPKTAAGEVFGRQVLRSGTSVGANVEEAFGASTKREFTYKLNIAFKEAKETHYWLRLIRDAGLVPVKRIDALIQEALEIKLILAKSIVTSQQSKARN